MRLTDAQEEVLVLLGVDEADDLDAGHLLVVDELKSAGLSEWCGETPALTADGRAALDRMLLD